MKDSKIYENIFEAIRFFEPTHPILDHPDTPGGLVRHQNFTLMGMEDGTVGAFALNWNMNYYRGENKDFPSCKPILYRITDWAERVICQIKAWDFILFLQEIPEIKAKIAQKEYIDFWALAQHYEFPTAMLDLTNDIMVAAFFAVHYIDPVTKQFAIKEDGLGQIRSYTGFCIPDGKLRPVGLQPLARPGLQSGFGLWLSEGEDLADQCVTVRFRHSKEANEEFRQSILGGPNMFMPKEPIGELAERIQKTNVVTRMAMEKYCEENGEDVDKIEQMLCAKGIYLADAPVVCWEMLKSLLVLYSMHIVRGGENVRQQPEECS